MNMINHLKLQLTGRLRYRFILTTVLVAVLILLIVGGYALWTASNLLWAQTVREQRAELDSLARSVSGFISGVQQDIIFISQSPDLQTYLALNQTDEQTQRAARRALEQEFLAFAQVRQIYDQIGFIDADGNEVIRIRTNADGISRLTSENQLQNRADRFYFQEIISTASGKIFGSPLELSGERGQPEILPDGSYKPIIRYGTPVIHNGQVVGLVVADVLAEKFLHQFETNPRQVFLVDADGYYLYHPDETKRWGRQLRSEVTLSSDFSPQVAEQILAGSGDSLTSSGNYISYIPLKIPDYPETWYLGSVITRQEIFGPIFDFTTGAFLVTVLALVVAILAAMILDRSIVNPIVDLKNAAVRMAGGDFQTQIQPATEDEIGTLTTAFNTMADQLKATVERLEERISERTRALEASAIISRQLTTILDADQLLKEVVERIQQTFQYYHVHIYLIDRGTNQVIMREGSGPIGQKLKARGHKLRLGQGIVGQVASSGVPILAMDVSTVSSFFRNPLLPDTESELAVPLRAGNTVLGVLDMQSDRKGHFSREDLTLMQSIADQVAVALENARLFEDVQRAAQEADDFARRLTRDTWTQIRTQVQPPGYVFADGEVNDLSSEDWIPSMGQAVLTKQIIQRQGDNLNGQPGTTSVSVPLLLRNEVIGVIGLERSSAEQWSEDELISLQTIANQLTLALESARLSRETERAAWRDQVVSESTAKVWSSAEIEEVMRTAVAQLGNRLQASEVVIRLGTEDEISDA